MLLQPMRQVKEKIRPGYEHINVHMIFEINTNGDFTIKEILVSDGQTKEQPALIKYSIIVSRESVIIEFLLAYFN